MVRGVVVVAGVIVSTTVSNAKSDNLTGADIKRLAPGATIYINTPFKTKIPVHYGADGSLTGSAGSMAFYLGAAKDTGQWRVVRDKLCHKWRRWFKGKMQCLSLRKRGNTIYWASQNGRTGTARYHRPEQPTLRIAANEAPDKPNAKPFAVAAVSPDVGKPAAGKKVSRRATSPAPSRQSDAGGRQVMTSRKSVAVPRKPRPENSQVRKEQVTSKPKSSAQRPLPQTNVQSQARGARQTAWQKVQSFRVARVDAFDMLNVRRGPSEYTSVVGRIPPTGRGVRIVGSCRQLWCPVVHNRVSGWVNRFYLTAER